VWLFSSGPVGDPSRTLVQKMGVDPVDLPGLMSATGAREHRMFAGRLEREHLPFSQRVALRLVRGLEGDFRDWTAISSWAADIADALKPSNVYGGAT
jgi:menaquinone-dependent protoporphyrinogen oxidase